RCGMPFDFLAVPLDQVVRMHYSSGWYEKRWVESGKPHLNPQIRTQPATITSAITAAVPVLRKLLCCRVGDALLTTISGADRIADLTAKHTLISSPDPVTPAPTAQTQPGGQPTIRGVPEQIVSPERRHCD
ncbi:MAG: hypothetical protein KAW89_04435, partial [Armatimonadetes bacterium]|nr:hypothetical protein [Armatimonadota bacterium]